MKKINIENNYEKYSNVKSVCRINNYKGTDPFISIVIPTFSRPNLLKQLLDVLRDNNQEREYEIVIVDNSAVLEDNNNEKLIRQYDDLPINYYINSQNIGMIGNWNRCIELAKSSYISMIHDDDLVSRSYIEEAGKIIDIIRKNKRIALIKASYKQFEGEELPVMDNDHTKKTLIPYTLTNAYFDGYSLLCGPTCGFIYQKEALIATGGFSEVYNMSSDDEYGYRILSCGYKSYYTSWNLGYYRFLCNETMKVKTIKDFVEKDWMIYTTYYKMTALGRLVFSLFARFLYSKKINNYLTWTKEQNIQTNLEELDVCQKYKKYGKIYPIFFRLCSLSGKFMKMLFHRKIKI